MASPRPRAALAHHGRTQLALAHILQPANEQNLDRWQAELRPPMVGKGGTRAG
jgi:hypothetical protein